LTPIFFVVCKLPELGILLHDNVPTPEQQFMLNIQATNECSNENCIKITIPIKNHALLILQCHRPCQAKFPTEPSKDFEMPVMHCMAKVTIH
jgi:hypothetical protein